MLNLKSNTKKSDQRLKFQYLITNIHGKVGIPILMYFLGVPGIVVILIWAFFFKGS